MQALARKPVSGDSSSRVVFSWSVLSDNRHEGVHAARDRVCGKPLDTHAACASAVYRGRTYYFCSASCHARFRWEPGKYGGTE